MLTDYERSLVADTAEIGTEPTSGFPGRRDRARSWMDRWFEITARGSTPRTAMLGGFMSASSNTTFIESNAGVAAGARTGLASVVTGALLLLCMFISPIAGIIPIEATAQALVIVGVMMFALVRGLRWDNTSPLATFATIIVMPVTYSIANGVGVGILLHTFGEILNRRRVSPLLVVFSGFFVWYFLHGTV